MRPVKVWLEQQRLRVKLLEIPVQLAIEGELKCLTAVRTLGIHLDRKFLVT